MNRGILRIFYLLISLVVLFILGVFLWILFVGSIFPSYVSVDFEELASINKVEVSNEDHIIKTIIEKSQTDLILNSFKKYSDRWEQKQQFGTPIREPSTYLILFYSPDKPPDLPRFKLYIGKSYLQLEFGEYKEVGEAEIKKILELLGIQNK